MKKKCYDLVFDGKKKKEKEIFFTELKKREFNNIIITVKDNCLDTRNTHEHTHTHFSISRKNNRQDKGKGNSFLI